MHDREYKQIIFNQKKIYVIVIMYFAYFFKEYNNQKNLYLCDITKKIYF